MTSLLIGLWVWPTVLATQVSPKDFPPAERAMRKHCAAVGEELIQRVHDYALTTSAGGGSHGAVITKMRQWVKDEKLADQVPDACLVEIVRLVYTRNAKEQKTRKEAEAEAEAKAKQVATWNALNEAEKSWVLRTQGMPGRFPGSAHGLTCNTLAVGAVGVFWAPVNVRHVDSRNGGFIICGLICAPIVTRIAPSYSGGTSSLGPSGSGGFGPSGSTIGPERPDRPDRYETTTLPDVLVWISGMDVKGLTTGTKLDLSDKAFEVIGTRTSVDALGGETIFEVRPVSVDPVLLSTITPPPGVTIDNYKEAVK
jgi:hypothetical protein